MANAKRSEVIVHLDGKDHTLRLNFNKICEIEQLLGGKSLLTADSMSMTSVRAILFAGLKDNPDMKGLTLNKIGKMIDSTDDFPELAGKTLEAVTSFFGEGDKGEEEAGVAVGETSGTT